MEYTFTLTYKLSEQDTNLYELVERLYSENCGDALVGLGRSGRIALQFVRRANSAEAALVSAVSDVERAMPGAKLIEVDPDC
nr:hypothetical protein [uncultured Albidiferax sp.]